MIRMKKYNIYLPQNLNTILQNYNNGSILWISGENSTVVQYLDTIKNNSLNIKMNDTNLVLTPTKLVQTQGFYKIFQKKYEKKLIQYTSLLNKQLQTAILHATVGIKKYLLVRGVGYKFIKKDKYLMLQVGYSHKINVLIPSFIKTKVNKKSTKIKFIGNNISFVTGLLSSIRCFKKPDVYKGKGIRYRKDNVMRKEGKKKKSF